MIHEEGTRKKEKHLPLPKMFGGAGANRNTPRVGVHPQTRVAPRLGAPLDLITL